MTDSYGLLLPNPRGRRKTPPRHRSGPKKGQFKKSKRGRRRNPANPANPANPRRRRRRRSTAVARRRNPANPARRRSRRRSPARRRSYRRNPRGFGVGGIIKNVMGGAYLAGAAIVGEGLTRLVMNKLGAKAIFAKTTWSETTQHGAGMILVGLAAEPVLKIARVPAKFRSLVGTANIAFGILKLTQDLQQKLWAATTLEGLGDYVVGGEEWGVADAPEYGVLGEDEGTYVPETGILEDYETVGDNEDWSGDPGASLQF